MGYLDFGRLENEALHVDIKQKSIQQCWMGAKAKWGEEKEKQGCMVDLLECGDDGVIQMNRLISLNCKKGNKIMIENY